MHHHTFAAVFRDALARSNWPGFITDNPDFSQGERFTVSANFFKDSADIDIGYGRLELVGRHY
jgi:hypothetical protein